MSEFVESKNEDIEIKALMLNKEDENLEFKEAKAAFNLDSLMQYCCALANEGGGRIILGITNNIPRTVVGSEAFRGSRLDEAKLKAVKELGIRLDVAEKYYLGLRVLAFTAPCRPIGKAVSYQGRYLMRAGESLVDMTDDALKKIFDENIIDFSAEINNKAIIDDLDLDYISNMQERWSKKSRRPEIMNLDSRQVLTDLGLIEGHSITQAAIVLLGKEGSIRKVLPNAEVIFEYRNNDSEIGFQERIEFKKGFFGLEQDLWHSIDKRNAIRSIQVGFFKNSIKSFNEEVVREAILNAISHREYRDPGSVFVKQYEARLEIQSPGGFPRGVDSTNILWKQIPRNRLICETLAKCGYVERSGQGADIMYKSSIVEGKSPPDYSYSDKDSISLRLSGIIEDPSFVEFIEKIGNEKVKVFSIDDFLLLNAIYTNGKIIDKIKPRINVLIKAGVIERTGRRLILSRGYYEFTDDKGEYTRQKGLDRSTNKALLCQHIFENNSVGSVLTDLCRVLPSLPESQVRTLLQELKREGKIALRGRTKGAKWFAVSQHPGGAPPLFDTN